MLVVGLYTSIPNDAGNSNCQKHIQPSVNVESWRLRPLINTYLQHNNSKGSTCWVGVSLGWIRVLHDSLLMEAGQSLFKLLKNGKV